jgi:alanine-synthesizing transaminase
LHGLVLLAALRLCSNVTAQWAVVPALTGPDTISALTAVGGRLHDTRRALLDAVASSRYLRVVQPDGALYAFPEVDRTAIGDFDDHAFALELLETENVLLVPGSSFNVPYRNHFRVTLLPHAAQMREVFGRIERALTRVAERGSMRRHVA